MNYTPPIGSEYNEMSILLWIDRVTWHLYSRVAHTIEQVRHHQDEFIDHMAQNESTVCCSGLIGIRNEICTTSR